MRVESREGEDVDVIGGISENPDDDVRTDGTVSTGPTDGEDGEEGVASVILGARLK